MTVDTSGVFICCSHTLILRGQPWSSKPPSPWMGKNMCCPTVRYGSTHAVYNWMHIEDPVKLLSIFFIFPTFVSTIGFLRSTGFKSLGQALSEYEHKAEVRYFFTGREPDPPIQDTDLPTHVVSHPEEPTFSKPSDQMVVSVPSTSQPPHLPELDQVDGSRTTYGATPVNTVCDRV